MAHFRYKAVSGAGTANHGRMQARSRADAVALLQAQGQIPIRVDEDGAGWLSALTRGLGRSRGSPRLAASIVRQLETLLRAGLPLDRALDLLAEQAASKAEAAVLRGILDRVRGGGSLSQAMAAEPLFPEFCVYIVRAGEMGGALEVTLGELAQQLDKGIKARERFHSALLYPAIVAIACVLSIVFLFAFVVPRFQALLENATAPLPWMTRAVLWTAGAVESYGWMLPIAAAGAALAAAQYLRAPANRRRWSARLLRVPFLGSLVLKAEVGQFCRVLGTLLKAGVPLPRALEASGQTLRNPALAAAVAEASRDMKEGKGLSEPLLRTGLFPRFALRLLRIGEEAARLDDMLLEIAEVYGREIERDMERLAALMGPALTIVLGLLVAVVIGSILVALLGVYQLTI